MPGKPLRWGWFAAVRGIENGHWMSSGEASDLVDVPVKTLSHWAGEGVISYIHHQPRSHRRYLREELQELINVLESAPTLWMIRDYIASQLVER
jgi:hypothetical protein